MVKASQGYLQEDGRFVTEGELRPPARKRLFVVWEDEPVNESRTDDEEIEKRLKLVQSLSGILPPDVDLEAARAERIAKRGLVE